MFDAIFPWIKALHIVAVISWMAALLYLPRLFVYHSGLDANETAIAEKFKIMEFRLASFIMEPALGVTWICGILMVVYYGWPGLLVSIWFAVKFVAVILMTGFHYWLKARMRDFQADNNKISERNYRFANEIPTVLMIIIVVMVIVKPF